jgi:hypothetical protein
MGRHVNAARRDAVFPHLRETSFAAECSSRSFRRANRIACPRHVACCHHGTMLAMPTRTMLATLSKDSHDAPRSPHATRDEAAAHDRQARRIEPDEAIVDDAYDNIACTD